MFKKYLLPNPFSHNKYHLNYLSLIVIYGYKKKKPRLFNDLQGEKEKGRKSYTSKKTKQK